MRYGRRDQLQRAALTSLVLLALGAAALLPASALAAGAPYEVGAARVDITPPPASDATATPPEFASCAAALDGPRKWAFDEPYVDADASGDFNYPNGLPEPYCDANHNGRWDGIYISGGVNHPAGVVHDPIDARALAISDGNRTVVIVSVVAQGIFENYTGAMRRQANQLRPGIGDVVVSANHNESSPDTVGIYGAPPVPNDIPAVGGAVGENSGIDDYYMTFLEHQVALAAARAYDDRRPATLWASRFRVNQEGDGLPAMPARVTIDLSKNFPTTADDGSPAAVDPNARVLQARTRTGRPIATMLNLAAHNQEIGHSDAAPYDISSDWPGYFHRELQRQIGGMAMFLVGDNGSEEDPVTAPPVGCPEDPDACYAQAQATGEALARATAASAKGARQLGAGGVRSSRDVFFAPLENNLFKAAAAAGLFGKRKLYTHGVATGRTGRDLRTSVATIDVGPDLQFLANPGEAFPALMVGGPWGIDHAGCPERPNPPVPTWHAYAANRFQIGLADDMIGYEEPAWAFSSLPGGFNYYGPPDQGGPATCVNDIDDHDPRGHQHKLETEGAGPTASNLVARNLTELLDRRPDPVAHVRLGRYLYRDGTTSRRPERTPADGDRVHAVAIWLSKPGTRELDRGAGKIVALPGIRAFGSRRIDESGQFMDFDGRSQANPGITTRGMLTGRRSDPKSRYYVNVYPALTVSSLGPGRAEYRRSPQAPASEGADAAKLMETVVPSSEEVKRTSSQSLVMSGMPMRSPGLAGLGAIPMPSSAMLTTRRPRSSRANTRIAPDLPPRYACTIAFPTASLMAILTSSTAAPRPFAISATALRATPTLSGSQGRSRRTSTSVEFTGQPAYWVLRGSLRVPLRPQRTLLAAAARAIQ